MNNYEYLLSDLTIIDGIGLKTAKLFKKKNINTIFDILFKSPRSYTDRSKEVKIDQLQIGSINTTYVKVSKYNFPRLRNLPNKVICEDDTGILECVFFNSFEGYIKKILPLNTYVTLSGKVTYYKKKYQIINPTYVSSDTSLVKKIHSKYGLTEGLSEKKYLQIIDKILKNIPNIDEWQSNYINKKFNCISWREAIIELHNPKNINKNGNFLNRLIYDEIFANLLINSQIRTRIKKIKKKGKKFENSYCKLLSKLKFNLTKDQINSLNDINNDLRSKSKMFRLLQGDVGSGKTIVSLIASLNVINSGFQVAFMAPTEILAYQHYNLAKKIFPKEINCEILTGKTLNIDKKKINKNLMLNEIKIIFGTHSLFQEKVTYFNLGLIIIDEQHKFGVRQRKNLSDKGGKDCDVLVMSATPIPRTMIMTIFGDMDVSIIREKPSNRKEIKTYSKSQNNLIHVIKYVKKEILNKNQVFWVCPLIEESKKVDHQSAIKRFKFLQSEFGNRVGLLHGAIESHKKDKILFDFLNRSIDILVSTTVIEVGIDFPNANVIVIENANKFGLSQLHQLRGRVGRGNKSSSCILMFKSTLSNNAKKRIKILKSTNDGFLISEEDLKLRGFGDLLGFKQSGIQTFRLADPIKNEDLFLLAEKEIKRIEKENQNFSKYRTLIKLYDRADIVNDIV